MNTCKTCKHWAGKEGARRGQCTNPKLIGYEDRDNVTDDSLSLEDDEGQLGYIETGRDFGCIHFLDKLKRLV